MKKKQTAMLVGLVGVIAALAAISWQQAIGKSGPTTSPTYEKSLFSGTNQPLARDASSEKANIPKHVAYGLFFGEMQAFKKKAEENEQRGLDGASLRNHHKQRAGLNDQQAQVLDRVAAECDTAVLDLNHRAKRVIDLDRARHPHGKIKEGETLPIPPQELRDLEDQRTTTVLQAREKLRMAFGDKEFKRFDDFVQQDIEKRAKTAPRVNRHR